MSTATRTATAALLLAAWLGATGVAAAQQDGAGDRDERAEARKIALRTAPFALQGAERGHLGVEIDDLDRRDAEDAGLSRVRGVRVTAVSDASPAADGGIAEGDLILRFDGEEVRSARHLIRLVAETPPERTVEVELLRDGDRRTAEVTVGDRPGGWPGTDPERMELIHDRIEDAMERHAGAMRKLKRLEKLGERFDADDLDVDVRGHVGFGDRGRLGVRLQPLTEQLAEHFGAAEGGALVASVREGSPADEGGLRAGDVLVRIGERDVRGPADAARAVRRAEAGPAAVTVVRDGDERSVTVELPEAGEGDQSARSGPAGVEPPAPPSGPPPRPAIHAPPGVRTVAPPSDAPSEPPVPAAEDPPRP